MERYEQIADRLDKLARHLREVGGIDAAACRVAADLFEVLAEQVRYVGPVLRAADMHVHRPDRCTMLRLRAAVLRYQRRFGGTGDGSGPEKAGLS